MDDDSKSGLPALEPILRIVPMPAEENSFGAVFGGWLMSQLDIAGGIVAIRRARGKVTTAAAKVDFEKPLCIGDIVSFYARIARCGRTSITVEAEVFAERRSGGFVEAVRAAKAELVYVAIDEEGRKRELPPES